MDNIFYFIEKMLSNLGLIDFVKSFFQEIIGALISILFGKLSLIVKNKLNRIRDIKRNQILKVSQTQIEKYSDGRIESQSEKHDALDYLQHDLRNKLHSINNDNFNNERRFRYVDLINDFLSMKNIILISLAVLIVQVIGIVLRWDFVDRLVSIYIYLFPSFILIIALMAIIKDFFVYRSYKQRMGLFMKEINSALLTIGTNLHINMLIFLDMFYEGKISVDPKEIQKIFSLIGVQIRIEDIARVALAYRYRNATENEKKKLSINILENTFKGLGIDYSSLASEGKEQMEHSIFEDYINDPFVKVKVIPL